MLGPLTYLDAAVLAIALISGLLAMYRGLTRELLSISSSVPFYISIGALVYHLGFVPLVIYSRYFKQSSPDFVEIYIFILYGINYFIYSLYTLGFLLCSRKKRSF